MGDRSVNGAPGERTRQPHIKPSSYIGRTRARLLALIAFVTVVWLVVSGVIAVLLHMKFGPPGMPPTVIVDIVTGLAAVPYFAVCDIAVASETPLLVPLQAALPVAQVNCAEVVTFCTPDWLPLVLIAVPPLVADTVNVFAFGTVFT